MKNSLSKALICPYAFTLVLAVSLFASAVILAHNYGRDLRVNLFGVEQVLQKDSPYRDLPGFGKTPFLYAPGAAILGSPFLLKSKMAAPLEFTNILPSVFAWYVFKILALAAIAVLLLRLIPAANQDIQIRNLKLSLLMALPFISYELLNSQNKIPALLFMLIAVSLFEKKKMLLSAVSFCLALTVYIPLLVFLFYFLLRTKGKFAVFFVAGVLIVFLFLPSLALGFKFNLYLLKDWFNSVIKPFVFTDSYATYIDLRQGSQSLPSAIGRLFFSGNSGYLIPAGWIHIFIRCVSAVMVGFSCLVVWKRSNPASRGLEYALFLILALILPPCSMYYIWAWLFVVYFAVFNYISHEGVPEPLKRNLLAAVLLLLIASWPMGIANVGRFSLYSFSYIWLWLFVPCFAIASYIVYPQPPAVQKIILLCAVLFLFILNLPPGADSLGNISFIFWGTLTAWLGIMVALRKQPVSAEKTRR